jgi:uncharacterized phage-associated protein
MHDARAIANFFIDRSILKGPPITVMTLLKVMYFSHAWHLAQFGTQLVAQPFEAWQHGPVNRVVYDQFKGMGSNFISTKAKSLDVATATYVSTKYILNDVESKYLSNVFDYYAKFHPFKLSDLTHEEGGPWDTIWRQAEKRAVLGMVIPNELIAAWFLEKGGVDSTIHEHLTVS